MFNLNKFVEGIAADTEESRLFIKHCVKLELDPAILNAIICDKASGNKYKVLGLVQGRGGFLIKTDCYPAGNESCTFFNFREFTKRNFNKFFQISEM